MSTGWKEHSKITHWHLIDASGEIVGEVIGNDNDGWEAKSLRRGSVRALGWFRDAEAAKNAVEKCPKKAGFTS